jgi:hypothetical protein
MTMVESTSTKNTEESVDAKSAEEIVENKRIKDAEKLEKAGKCAEEIKGVLAKWNCDFDVSVLLRHNGVFPNIQIVAKE